MIDKRFILDDPLNYRSTCGNTDNCIEGFALVENEAPFKTFNLEEVVELLNNLYEEKEDLKQVVESLENKNYDYKQDLRDADSKYQEYECKIKSLQDKINELTVENEELKQENNKLAEIFWSIDLTTDEALTVYGEDVTDKRFEYHENNIYGRVFYSILDTQTNQNYSKERLSELADILNNFYGKSKE